MKLDVSGAGCTFVFNYKKTPNQVDLLQSAILSRWALSERST